MPKKLELVLLADIEIRLDGLPVTDCKSNKAQALLYYLAVTGRAHSRSTLAGLLWGDMPEAKARSNLSQALTVLRRSFGSFLIITRQTVAFDRDSDFWLDVQAFEANATAFSGTSIEALGKAAELYRGDFLDDFYVRNAAEFENWILVQRARLHEWALQVLHRLITYHAEQGEEGRATAIDYSGRLLALEPWREEAHRQMMHLLALNGRRTAALVQYEKCRQILAEELDVEPGAKTTALYEQIRDGDLSKENEGLGSEGRRLITHRHSLPAQTPLIGRKTELAELNRLLSDPAMRLVTICGAGGMGKTHLAIAVAHQMAKTGCFRDGVFFVPLTQVTTRALLVTAIAEQLGLALTGTRQPEKTLLDFLRGRDYLLALDNFEQLLPEADFLMRSLEIAPRSKLLVTSRERLRLREEWVLDLGGLPYPDTAQEAQSSNYDAVLLFSQRAHQIRSSFSLQNNLAGVVRICQLTQGMPLAIEQAASLIRVIHAGEIADQIESSLATLSTTRQNLPERHRNICAVFDGSWRWLSQEERKVFCRLSVFRGSFSREAAEQVTGASLLVLAGLVDKSLLRRGPGQGESSRYDLHELVRQYAAGRLIESDPTEAALVHEAHLGFFLFLAEQAEQFWDAGQEREWLERLEAERANLHAALGWATERGKAEQALRLNAALFTFWLYNSPAAEAVDWLEASLSMAWNERSPATMRARAKALNVAGYAALPISDFELAKVHFEEGAALYSTLGDQRGLAWSLRGCSFLCLILGDLTEAHTFAKESLGICQKIQDEWGMAWSEYDLGSAALAGADLARTGPLLEAALAQFHRLGIQFGAYRALISLGHLARAQENWGQAETCYREALASQQKNHYIQFVAQLLEGVAHIAVADNNSEIAVQLFGAAQARRDSIEMARWTHQEIAYQRGLALTQSQLSLTVWQAAWEMGYAMTPGQEVAFALNHLS